MASAKASDPQTWNRYAYTLNNPLRYVDPDGLEVPDDCVQDPECTIAVKINVIYDYTVNKRQGLTEQQKQRFEEDQIAKAQKEYGTSNIKLDVTYTAGTYTVDANGELRGVIGLNPDSLNLLVSTGTPSGKAGVSAADRYTGTALTIININRVRDLNIFLFATNTTVHEFGHQFLGHVYLPKPSDLGEFWRETVVDWYVLKQADGFSQQSFREGLAPRRYAAPLNPEAIKPRQ